jgi:hypothetical protein
LRLQYDDGEACGRQFYAAGLDLTQGENVTRIATAHAPKIGAEIKKRQRSKRVFHPQQTAWAYFKDYNL